MNECGLELLGFFGELGEDSVNVGPVEADARGLASELNRFEEGREGAGHAVEDGDGILDSIARCGSNPWGVQERFLALLGMTGFVNGGRLLGGAFLLFDDFPVAEDVSGGFGGGRTEDMRVAAHHFVVDFADDVGDGEALLFVSDLGVEKNLEKEIAKFFGKLRVFGGVQSVEDFVSFLDKIGAKSGVGLFAVPGTAAGGAETGHNGDEFFEITTDVRRGVPFRRSLARRRFFARLCGLATGFARCHGPIREKLRDDSLYGGPGNLTSDGHEEREWWQAAA